MREFIYILGSMAVIIYGLLFGLIGLSELWITSQDEEGDEENEKNI